MKITEAPDPMTATSYDEIINVYTLKWNKVELILIASYGELIHGIDSEYNIYKIDLWLFTLKLKNIFWVIGI